MMLKNLINNALKYNDNKSASIEVLFDASDYATVISIIDSGPGLSDDQLKFFGEPFYRVKCSR